MIITRKINVYVDLPKEQKDEAYKKIRDYQYKCFKAANEMMRLYYMLSDIKKDVLTDHTSEQLNQLLFTDKGYKGATLEAYAWRRIRENHNVLSYIADGLFNKVKTDFNNDKKELIIGKRSVRSYKKDFPIPIISKSLISKSIRKIDKNGFVFDGIPVKFIYGRDKSNNRSIVNKTIEGEYVIKQSWLKLKDRKLTFGLCVEIPESNILLDKNIICGVDLGVNVPAYVALNEGHSRKAIGDGRYIIRIRTQIRNRRKLMSKRLVSVNGGHGRAHKMRASEHLGNLERNFAHTTNHQISKQIIDFALKNNAGTIKIEDLTGITKHNKFFKANWAYYQLQSMIKYKAKMHNIEVVVINPAYTSQKCSKCGNVDKDCRISQSVYICNVCAFNENADYNAAVNIARSENVVLK